MNDCYVYVLRHTDGRVLYIGSTRNLTSRLVQHRNGAVGAMCKNPIVSKVAFDTPTEARFVERFMIEQMQPLLNVNEKSGLPPMTLDQTISEARGTFCMTWSKYKRMIA